MALTKITRGVIKANENYDTHNINSTGIVTAVSANFTGNVSIGGTLTYQDVTNIDSVGIITARAGVDVNNGHIVLDSGYSLQWSDSHERIEQSDGKLEFFTNNTEKVTISGGNLGIGDVSPTYELEVASSDTTTLNITAGGNTNISRLFFSDGDAVARGYLNYEHNGDNLLIATAGSERLRIKSDGDVFIGNIAHANDGGANSSYRTLTLADNNNGAQIHLRGQSPKLFMDVTSGGNGEIYYDSGDLRILSGEPGGTSSEKIRITSDGKFGIGTTTPSHKLSVYGNIYQRTSDYITWNNGDCQIGGVSGYHFAISTYDGSSALLERVRITGGSNGGRVGIGTVNPGSKLTVYETGGNAKLQLQRANTANNTDDYGSVLWRSAGGTAVGAVNVARATAENDGYMFFQTTSGGTMSERMRVHPTGQVSINSTGYMGRFHIQQNAITEPALSIRHHDASLYKHMGTAGPNDRNGTNASNGGTYLHVRVRTVWNDSSMTMFRITGYYPYHDYTHSFVGMYRYGNNSYRTNPYGQTINNLKRSTIHSIYNEAASPGYLVFVCDWPTNYTGLMFEHIGAGTDYGAYMQNDIEIIDSLRSSGTSALTF